MGERDLAKSVFKKNLVLQDSKIWQKYDNFHCDKALRSPTVVKSCPVFVTFQHRCIKRSVSDLVQYLENMICWQWSNFLLRLMTDYQIFRLFIILEVYESTYASDVRTKAQVMQSTIALKIYCLLLRKKITLHNFRDLFSTNLEKKILDKLPSLQICTHIPHMDML